MLASSNSIPSGSRRVSLFRNGSNQAIRIPREFELPAQEALLFREGNGFIIEALPCRPTLLSTLGQLSPLEDSFPDVDESLLPVEPINLP
jgi:antitoxin VapB